MTRRKRGRVKQLKKIIKEMNTQHVPLRRNVEGEEQGKGIEVVGERLERMKRDIGTNDRDDMYTHSFSFLHTQNFC
jgi:hypothetical protein